MNAKRILKAAVNILKASIRGELLLKLNVGKYFLHIAWTFLLFASAIGHSIIVDKNLARVEKNSAELKDLQIRKATKEYELKSLYRRTSIEQMLKDKGSELREPVKAGIILKK